MPASPETPPSRLRIASGVIQLGEQPVPFFAGSFHYFRSPRSRWRDALLGIKDLGLSLVDIYAPWGVHETAPGEFDFGQEDENKDIAAFIQLAQALGLYVVLRPGPHINAELNAFGLPKHVLAQQEVRAVGPSGHAVPLPAPPVSFPVPSHDSALFKRQVHGWYSALAGQLAAHVYPKGPIVAVQVDNEAAFYFRDAPYDQDYHPEVLERYADFLKRRYKKLSQLQDAYGVQAVRWRELSPPRRFAARNRQELVPHLDWLECQEDGLVMALDGFRADLAGTGLSGQALLTHNMPMGDGMLPLGPAGLERQVAMPGTDYYERRQEMQTVKRRTLRLVGNVAFPFAAELGLGASPWLPPRKDRDSLEVFLCTLAFGLRGFNLYMAVDRDRWYGGALDAEGRPSRLGQQLQRLIHGLLDEQFFALHRDVKVAIMLPRLYRRMSRMTHTLSALSPALMDISGIGVAACRQDTFGFPHVIQQHWKAWVDGAAAVLDAAQVPYVYVDSDVGEARMQGMDLLLCPTFSLGDSELCQQLERAQRGGTTIATGPDRPQTNALGQPLSLELTGPLAALDLANEEGRTALTQFLSQMPDLRCPFEVESSAVEITVHGDAKGPKVAFLLNYRSQPLDAIIRLPKPLQLVDILNGDAFEGTDQLSVPMRHDSVRVFRIQALPEATQSAQQEPARAE